MSGLRQFRSRVPGRYEQFEASPEPAHPADANEPHSRGQSPDGSRDIGIGRTLPWFSDQPGSNLHAARDWHMLQVQDPDRLFSSIDIPVDTTDDNFQSSKLNMPPKLPGWVWSVVVHILGIGRGERRRHIISTLFYALTWVSALLYGFCGLFFNVYDAVSEYTRTTVLLAVAKTVLGLYWMGLGIYANSLGTRLFSNHRMVDSIRLHSKTFLKISTAVIVVILSAVVVAVNLMTDSYLLEEHHSVNETKITYANCASLGVSVALCKIYFGAKVFYSFFCLMWNVLVVGIILSVCRTHTISIRRFMKDLVDDTKIFEELSTIQALEDKRLHTDPDCIRDNVQAVVDSFIWDDDVPSEESEEVKDRQHNSNTKLLKKLRLVRMNTISEMENSTSSPQDIPFSSCVSLPNPGSQTEMQVQASGEMVPNSLQEEVTLMPNDPKGEQKSQENVPTPLEESFAEQSGSSENRTNPQYDKNRALSTPTRQISSQLFMIDGRPPLMRNEDLMFTYFHLTRRLAATSRLLQRWMSNWITFVMLWCALLIVYWTSHTAEISGIVQFLIPLAVLGLLTSAYAEVNFEGERLIRCIMPTAERMPVIYYFQTSKLELKIFSFTMTYNTIVTVVAGVAITFATRIVLDQFGK